MKIVIPGGSGQVGHILARHFHERCDEVVVLSRTPRSEPWRMVRWDAVSAGDWVSELESSDVCINLTGRSVNCRYSASNQRTILESRVQSTRVLGEAISSLKHPPAVWMNASTATIYRHALDRPMDEATGELGGDERGAPSTWNFSIRVAKAWEEAFLATPTPGTRKVSLRSAMTFSPDRGGVFDEFLRLVRLGMGGRQGSGEQYVSWIHEQDFVRAVEFLIFHAELSGAINVSSPNPVPNKVFMKELRAAWGTRFGPPIPTLLIEAGAWLMRTESELILKSRRVIPSRLRDAGFSFQFPDWSTSARDLVARWRGR